MIQTQQTIFIKDKFFLLKKSEKLEILEDSNLTEQEIELLIYRLVKGLTIKECSNIFCLEENTIIKKQSKAYKKLYLLLNK